MVGVDDVFHAVLQLEIGKQQIFHGVEASGFFLKVLNGEQDAIAKGLADNRFVLQAHGLVGKPKQDFMDADNAARPARS